MPTHAVPHLRPDHPDHPPGREAADEPRVGPPDDRAVEDLVAEVADDRAVDQLVDELSARIHALRRLLSEDDDSSPWPDAAIRRSAAAAVHRLRRRRSRSTALAVVEVLWPGRAPDELDEDWLRTPLGRLLHAVLSASAAASRPAPARPSIGASWSRFVEN